MAEKSTEEVLLPQPECTPERYCDRLAFVLVHSPQSMPWVMNPVKFLHEEREVKGVTIMAGKDTEHSGKQLLLEYCPFCRADISPKKKVEPKSKIWTPFGRRGK